MKMTALDFMKTIVNGVDGDIDLCLDRYDEIKKIYDDTRNLSYTVDAYAIDGGGLVIGLDFKNTKDAEEFMQNGKKYDFSLALEEKSKVLCSL
jgi:hypothetical protein